MKSAFLIAALSVSALAAPFPKLSFARSESGNANITRITTTDASAANPINALVAAVGMLPGIGASISALSGVITQFQAGLAEALNIQTNEDQAACAAMTVIFARGTTEPGNVGVLTGPEFFDALEAVMGENAVAVQGVEYGASIEGFLQGGDPEGSKTMAAMISDTLTKCPSTKLVVSGYSQGGQLVHNAAQMLPAATMAKVSSVIIFGDPDDGEAVAGATKANTLVICHDGDNICAHGDLILLPHLTYSVNAQQAAKFAAAQSGLSLGS